MKKMIFQFYFIINIIGVLSVKSNVQRILDIPIAENRSITECINGKPYSESKSEMFITTSQLITKLGYPAEEHLLLTDDGFLLTVHRIPGAAGASPVFLQPGIACSSFDYVVSGKGNALALILADKGYDVWIGNSRGNTYSQCHTNFTRSEYQYWNFSWHEMGVYDLPTVVSYITNVTNQDIMFIGYSMGTTMFCVMAIEKPDIASKVKAMFGLSCVSYLAHVNSPLRFFAPFIPLMEILVKIVGGVFIQEPLFRFHNIYLYYFSLLQKLVNTNLFLFLIRSFSTAYADMNFLRQVLYHTPAGTSIKAINHFLQEINSGRFQYYDYGREGNLRMYNNTAAPDYDLSKIKVPIAVFWSDNGDVINKIDVQKLYEQVPNKIISYKIEAPIFNHLDYIWGKKAPKFLYPKLLSLMETYK